MNGNTEAGLEHTETIAAPSKTQRLRVAQLIRAGVLVVVGVIIAFTAPLHSDVDFDRLVIGFGLLGIGIATLIEYGAALRTAEAWWIAARAVVAFSAAGSLIAAADSLTLALVVVLWAALTAVITLMRLTRKVQPPRVALPSMILSIVLAVAAFITREDPVAVIGFFGAYAIIRGVFLAIAALDTATPAADPALTSSTDVE